MDTQPKTRKGLATKFKMVETAALLMRKQGMAATTVNDILTASETGKSQFSHYFGSKESLIAEVIDYHGQKTIEENRKNLAQIHSIDDFEKWFEKFIKIQKDCLKTYQVGCPLGQLALELPFESEQLNEKIKNVLMNFKEDLTRVFELLQKNEQLPQEICVNSLASLLLAALEGGFLLSKIERTEDPLTVALQQVFSYIKLISEKC